MTPVIDIHTHRPDAPQGSVINVEPAHFAPLPGRLYSVGHHPWSAVPESLESLWHIAVHPQVVAIGETGLDSLRGAPLEVQTDIFKQHIAVAQAANKPIVAHMVRTSGLLIKAWREMRPEGIALAIHGMRGNENVARTLVEAGCYLSYGERFNAAALMATPLDRILAETDESITPIEQIIASMARTLGMNPATLTAIIAHNTATLLHRTNDPAME